jgi:hypothetical protein
MTATTKTLRFEQDPNGTVHLLFRTYDEILRQEEAWREVQAELERIRQLLNPIIDRDTRVTINNATKLRCAQLANQVALRALKQTNAPLAHLELEKNLFVQAIATEMSGGGSTVH